MVLEPQRQRHGQAFYWLVGLLVVVLLVLVGIQVYNRFFLYERDEERIRKLQEAGIKNEHPAATTSQDWPQWRGLYRDGIASGEGLLTAWPEDLLSTRQRWEVSVGDGYSSIAVADGRVYTTYQEGQREMVACWDAETGKELWKFAYDSHYDSREGSGPRSTPTVDGDRVYTVGGAGVMHCLEAKTGKKLWEKDLLKEFKANNLQWGVSFSPLIEGDLVLTNPGGPGGYSIVALDKLTGEVRWHSQDDVAGYSSPVISTACGVRQVLFFTGSALVSLNPKDGKLYWRYPWRTNYECNVATPIALDNYVFISSGYGKGCALVEVEKQGDGSLQARKVYHSRVMRNHMATCVFHAGHLYGFNEGSLTCIQFASGERCWEEAKFGKGSLLLAGNNLIVLGDNGTLALVEASPEGFHEKGSCQVFDGSNKNRCWSMPVLANGRLYVRDMKRLLCIDLRQ